MADPTGRDEAEPLDLTELQRWIATSFDLDKFKTSNAGRFFSWRAQEDIIDALERIKSIDPYAPDAVPCLAREQLTIRVCERFFVWMAEAIDAGKDAAAQMQIAESEPIDPV